MKTNILIIAMTALMIVFVLGALQTIEFSLDNNLPIPWQAWGLFISARVWFFLLKKMSRQRRKEMDNLFRRLEE